MLRASHAMPRPLPFRKKKNCWSAGSFYLRSVIGVVLTAHAFHVIMQKPRWRKGGACPQTISTYCWSCLVIGICFEGYRTSKNLFQWPATVQEMIPIVPGRLTPSSSRASRSGKGLLCDAGYKYHPVHPIPSAESWTQPFPRTIASPSTFNLRVRRKASSQDMSVLHAWNFLCMSLS